MKPSERSTLTLAQGRESTAEVSGSGNQIRVLIADDHAVIREGIVVMLIRDAGISVVGEAQDGVQAVALYRKHQPDVALIDVTMPRMDGIAAARAIRGEFPHACILLLTLSEKEEDIYQGIQAGVQGYLPKTIGCSELIEAIRGAASGNHVIPPHIAATFVRRMQSTGLTARELEILHWMAQGEANIEIGNRLFISEATARAHVSNILSKLGARNRTQAVLIAIKRGILRV